MTDEEAQNAVYEFWNSNAETCGLSARLLIGRDRSVDNAVDDLFPNIRNLKILDVGTGGGFSSISLALSGHKVTSIDICPEMILQARKNSRRFHVSVKYLQDDIQHSSLADCSFDLVVFYQTLFTVVDCSVALMEATRLLCPGGRILIMDGNYWLEQRLEEFGSRKEYFHLKYGKFEMQMMPIFAGLDYTELERSTKHLYAGRVRRPGWEVWNFLDTGMEDIRINTMDTRRYSFSTATGKMEIALLYLISARKPFGTDEEPASLDENDIVMNTAEVDFTNSEKVFSALSSTDRIQILNLLLASPLSVHSISDLTNTPQTLTTYNLGMLKKAGLVMSESKGRERIYRIINPSLTRSILNMARYIGQTKADDTV